jgi:hypothetical protein
MRDFVEAGFDVPFYDPLIRAGREVVDLRHRVVGPAPGTEPVGAREEIRLEDRLQHQLQGRLGHPVPDGGDGDFILPLLQTCVGMFRVGAGQVVLADLLA